ncbi:hypothetical protein NUSPORA_01600 [Nucleospora cyclopteri]
MINYFFNPLTDMGKKAIIKKIKKMKYKKEEKEKIEESESFEDSDELHKEILSRNIVKNIYRPPYQVILDTNFINDCIRKKVEPYNLLMECLFANVDIYITDCVYSELEKLGRTFRLALNMIKKIEHIRLSCDHKGNYADNCILDRVRVNNIFMVATSDVNLKQRISKKVGSPVLIFRGRKLVAENFHNL